jgi:hypothetical protein
VFNTPLKQFSNEIRTIAIVKVAIAYRSVGTVKLHSSLLSGWIPRSFKDVPLHLIMTMLKSVSNPRNGLRIKANGGGHQHKSENDRIPHLPCVGFIEFRDVLLVDFIKQRLYSSQRLDKAHGVVRRHIDTNSALKMREVLPHENKEGTKDPPNPVIRGGRENVENTGVLPGLKGLILEDTTGEESWRLSMKQDLLNAI